VVEVVQSVVAADGTAQPADRVGKLMVQFGEGVALYVEPGKAAAS